MRVTCLSLYPEGTAPGSRFRYEQYIGPLRERGIEVTVLPFFSEEEYHHVRHRSSVHIPLAVLRGYLRRIKQLCHPPKSDVVWLYREATPLGPPVLEWIAKHWWRQPIVYEFDDAIWTSEKPESFLIKLLRCRWKVAALCGMADRVVVGNAFLKEFANSLSSSVTIVPTSVDTVYKYNSLHVHGEGVPVIGWTGSRSTNRYLEGLGEILSELRRNVEFELQVVSDRQPVLSFANARFFPWDSSTEVAKLLSFDIGIMPLEDTQWERGKCGFKLIQYMALGIPPVASAVGANAEIIRNGIDGYLCCSRDEWLRRLRELVEDPAKRRRMGQSARERVEQLYSSARQSDALARIFLNAGSGNGV